MNKHNEKDYVTHFTTNKDVKIKDLRMMYECMLLHQKFDNNTLSFEEYIEITETGRCQRLDIEFSILASIEALFAESKLHDNTNSINKHEKIKNESHSPKTFRQIYERKEEILYIKDTMRAAIFIRGNTRKFEQYETCINHIKDNNYFMTELYYHERYMSNKEIIDLILTDYKADKFDVLIINSYKDITPSMTRDRFFDILEDVRICFKIVCLNDC